MAQLITRVTDPELFVDAGQIDIVDEGLECYVADESATGIVDARPGGSGAAVICATEIGHVVMTAELWDGPPPLCTDGWQDVADMPLHWLRDEAMEIGGEGTSLTEPPTFALRAGLHMIRVAGRHRDEPDPRDDRAPAEEYLIQVWPAHPGAATAGPVLHKRTSALAARRTALRAGLPRAGRGGTPG
ncbi:hypothetical protein AB0C96_25450 [Streptomyces sp. NPDC048506]|uniref:hypothetical protein n=1 Tax=Streptomyces sp. NPDC048506 TaxID=3155028 RepID=UPI00342F6BF4